MYLAIVALLMFIAPIGTVVFEHLHTSAPFMLLVGKWFVFWSVGVRLLLAGLRQFFQPAFTAREIFHMQSEEALPLVRELGVANFASGVVGVASLWQPAFVLPAALAASIFYGVAGVRHVAEPGRSRNQTVAMVSDLFAFVTLAAFVLTTYIVNYKPS
jgi:hypothetical protein